MKKRGRAICFKVHNKNKNLKYKKEIFNNKNYSLIL
jgi:hypothetical protein